MTGSVFPVAILVFCAGLAAAQDVSAVAGDSPRSPFFDRPPFQVVPFRHQFFQVFAVGTVQNSTAPQQPTVIPQVIPIPIHHGQLLPVQIRQQHHPAPQFRMRPQLFQEVVNVPSLQRYLQTSHIPVLENIHYEAIPVEATDVSRSRMAAAVNQLPYSQCLRMP